MGSTIKGLAEMLKRIKQQKSIVQFIRDRFNKWSLVVLPISIGIVNFFVFLPYLKGELLIGWDTPIYMYSVFYVEKYGVAATFMSGVIDKPLFALILYMLSKSGASPEQLLKVTPMMFSSLCIVSIYLLSREGSHDGVLASLAALFSSCAFATLRLANEVQPHLLAFGCMIIGMFFHLKYINNGDRRFIIFSIIIALFILGVHPLAYGTYIAILVLSFLMARAKRSQKSRREMTSLIVCILPLISVMVFLLFTSLTPVVTLAESLLHPRVIEQTISHHKLMHDLAHSMSLLIFSIIGIAILLRSRGTTFRRMLLAWTASFSLASLLCASLGATFANRFILTLPLPILVAYGYAGWPKKAHLKYLILIAVLVTNFSIATQYQSNVKPWIGKELRDELVWVRENLGDKLVIPVCPLNSAKGYWVWGIVGDYLYYGEVLPFLARKPENYYGYPGIETSLYWKRLEDDGVFKNLAEYKIVLIGGVYELGIVDEQIVEKVENHDIYVVNHSVLTNESKIDYYYQVWRKFKDAKIAIIGDDWSTTRKILYELWIPPVPAGFVTPKNIEYLGTRGLPVLEKPNKYDILILADWNVAQNKTEAERLLEYFKEGCAIVATSKSIYELYNVSTQIVVDIFGIEKAYPPNAFYSNITYRKHFITSVFSIPFNSTGAEYGFPVSNLNLTTAEGIATVASSEDLYLLVVNQMNETRAAHFGLRLSKISENDVTIFKRLLLWALHLETYLK